MVSKCLPDIYMQSLGFGNDRISVNLGYNGFETKLRFVCAPKGEPKELVEHFVLPQVYHCGFIELPNLKMSEPHIV